MKPADIFQQRTGAGLANWQATKLAVNVHAFTEILLRARSASLTPGTVKKPKGLLEELFNLKLWLTAINTQ